MAIEIEPYAPERVAAVRALNQRLKAGGCAFRFPECSESSWLPKAEGENIFEEFFVANDGDAVRGGYVLKHQPFWLGGEAVSIGSLYLPLSEGTVDRKFARLGAQLLMDALHRQPLLYSLGMGGLDNPYPRLLRAAGWRMFALPFHFLVLNANAFCKNIVYLRRRPAARMGLDFLAATGLGSLGFRVVNALRRPRGDASASLKTERIWEFGGWVDDVWNAGRAGCTLGAVRNTPALRRLYPANKERYLKLKVTDGGTDIGWAVLFDTVMRDHKQFGNMRVGSIIDCFAAPGRENDVTLAAVEFLRERSVDLIVSNQSHREWNAAFRRAGMMAGPSNFIFAASPDLAARIGKWEDSHTLVHFTRADGEGPSHL